MNSGSSELVVTFVQGMADRAQAGIAVVGGKGINLCELAHAGFNVPPGFVVTTEAYRRFVAAAGIAPQIEAICADLDMDDPEAFDRASEAIRALFLACPVPDVLAATVRSAYRRLREAGGESVAVRSSATAEDLPDASFAGQQDTYLNIVGEAPLIDAMRRCWASLWTARAMSYRNQQHIPREGLALAVVVQKMAMADTAGILFTANPVTGARDEITINASWGLGESVVGGHVTPDTIVTDKATGAIRELVVAEKTVMTTRTADGTVESEVPADRRNARVLDDAQAAELTAVARDIEAHYGTPQDIEWAYEGKRLFLVQARPVTALPADPALVEKVRLDEITRLRGLAEAGRRVWVTHNLGETLRAPTPLTWDIVRHFMSGDGGFGLMYRDLGYSPAQQVCREGFLDLICGRIYADPERVAKLFWEHMPLVYNLDAVLKDKALLDAAPTEFAPDKAGPDFLIRLPGIVRAMIRASRRTKRARRVARTDFVERVLPPYLEYVKRKHEQDLTALTTADVISELDARIRIVLDEFGKESLKPGFFGGVALGALEGLLVQLMGEPAGVQAAQSLVMALEGDSTIEQNIMLHRVAVGDATMDEFIDQYGHRTIGEMELCEARWREDRTFLEATVAALKNSGGRSPADVHTANTRKREAAEAELPALLAKYGGSSFLEEIHEHVREARELLPFRETGKHFLMLGYDLVRIAIRELARRWELGEDVFFLHRAELLQFESNPNAFKAQIAECKARWQAALRLTVADVIASDDLERLGIAEVYESATELQGSPVASGIGEGPAAVIHDPRQAGEPGTGYILVCPSTDPGWTSLFVHANGLIVERGGVLSHGAIVARDFGIPAVVCPNATARINNGERLRIDGNRGCITRMES
jgi:rifampicin phosphotransferase